MRINYKNDVNEKYNWEADNCDTNYNGDSGAAHGYLCATQLEMEQCKQKEPDAATSIRLSIALAFILTCLSL